MEFDNISDNNSEDPLAYNPTVEFSYKEKDELLQIPSLKHQTNSSTSGSHLLQGRSAASINVRQRMSVSFVRKTELAHATLALCLRGLD